MLARYNRPLNATGTRRLMDELAIDSSCMQQYVPGVSGRDRSNHLPVLNVRTRF